MTKQPKPMKSPTPPKMPKIPPYAPQWQKDLFRNEYNEKYQNYIDNLAAWKRQNAKAPKPAKSKKQGVGNPNTPGFKMGGGTE